MSDYTPEHANTIDDLIMRGNLSDAERIAIVAARNEICDQAKELKARGEILDEIQAKAGTTSWLGVVGRLGECQDELRRQRNSRNEIIDLKAGNTALVEGLARKEARLTKAEACLREMAWRHRYKPVPGQGLEADWTDERFLTCIAEYFNMTLAALLDRMDAAAKGW